MPRLSNAEIEPLHAMADRIAGGLCRRLRLPEHEREDLRQSLLANLIGRLPAFDPTRSSLAAFALTCFRHRASLLAFRARRDHQARHPSSLDDTLPGGMTVGAALSEEQGYAAWVGQPTDAFAAVERRLDLQRAASCLTEEDAALCAALLDGAPQAAARAGLSRTTAFRRLHELRLKLSANGIASAG